ncbi:N-acetylglucosamine-6-phosphate deacetylase [Paenibacillus aurantius]|uniref:N-acetylglucosamine-6-phosphate deacetylase n=1 Tax=Paenibacillus aurantius TaxID=2918900 RepID=A0AA96LFR5_9BACL|nr:N-acetylglucosamine-6-phosphate deacetylase [Paenibacillus aurantius]WNQ12394.1 N-acetylglucosamine-6-phosphate deacetylase [Paenibacillus aurantius]
MTEKRSLLIRNASIVTDQGVSQEGELLVEDGKISWLAPKGGAAERGVPAGVEELDAEGGWILPGFIDVHIHGGFGHDFMDGTVEAIEGIARYHASHGTTGLLATTVTQSREAISQVLEAASTYRAGAMPYAQLLGVHLEGPFISPKFPGAQNPDFIVEPRQEWLEAWVRDYPGLIKLLTLAPERNGALELIEWLAGQGIIAAAGHTDASFDQITEAAGRGLSHAVHTFNAMRGLHHREPGTLGAVLTDNRIHAEVIADGHHVHPAGIRLLAAAKAPDRLLIITDAMSAAGLGDGEYDLGGLGVVVKDGVARLKEGGALAGSTLTMIDAFRYVLEHTDLSVAEVSRLASGNPAKRLGIDGHTGSLASGKDADFVWTSPQLDIRGVWVQGRSVLS